MMISTHARACRNPGPGFQPSHVVVWFVFNGPEWEIVLLLKLMEFH